MIDIIDCTTAAPWVYLNGETFSGARIRVQELDDQAWVAQPAGESSTFYVPWRDGTPIAPIYNRTAARVQRFTLLTRARIS